MTTLCGDIYSLTFIENKEIHSHKKIYFCDSCSSNPKEASDSYNQIRGPTQTIREFVLTP
jgi:hypothetical protein